MLLPIGSHPANARSFWLHSIQPLRQDVARGFDLARGPWGASGEGRRPNMAPTNFHLAPPSKVVDGLLAVPIDIQSIDAKLVFDGAAQSGSADATIAFTVGPTAGNPIFDLRQTITNAWLDGVPFPAAQVALHDFGGGALSELRVVQSVLNAGSVHTLRLQYTLGIPASQLGGAYPPALEWSPGPKLRFSFGLSDLNAGRYLEAWLPANLIFDQFSIHLDVEVINTVAGHSVITNGQVTGLGTNHWAIDFPARFTALSPLLELRASDSLQSQSAAVALPVSGATVAVEAWKLSGAAFDLAAQINLLKSFLVANENNYGPYVHGNRFVAFFNVGGMEYEGGRRRALRPSCTRPFTAGSRAASSRPARSTAGGTRPSRRFTMTVPTTPCRSIFPRRRSRSARATRGNAGHQAIRIPTVAASGKGWPRSWEWPRSTI